MSGNSGIRPPAASETVFVADDDPDFGKLDVPQEITESARVVTVYLTTPFGTEYARAQAVPIQADGRIVVGGSTLRGSRLCLVRLLP